MGEPFREMVGYQSAMTHHVLGMMLSFTKSYVSLMDPRPDLAIPARTMRYVYAWWW
jgi:hypothetical protein